MACASLYVPSVGTLHRAAGTGLPSAFWSSGQCFPTGVWWYAPMPWIGHRCATTLIFSDLGASRECLERTGLLVPSGYGGTSITPVSYRNTFISK